MYSYIYASRRVECISTAVVLNTHVLVYTEREAVLEYGRTSTAVLVEVLPRYGRVHLSLVRERYLHPLGPQS